MDCQVLTCTKQRADTRKKMNTWHSILCATTPPFLLLPFPSSLFPPPFPVPFPPSLSLPPLLFFPSSLSLCPKLRPFRCTWGGMCEILVSYHLSPAPPPSLSIFHLLSPLHSLYSHFFSLISLPYPFRILFRLDLYHQRFSLHVWMGWNVEK